MAGRSADSGADASPRALGVSIVVPARNEAVLLRGLFGAGRPGELTRAWRAGGRNGGDGA